MQKNSFDMKTVCVTAKNKLKQKTGKKVSASFVRAFWKDYVYLSLIPDLLRYGKVQVDKNFSIEIVGKKQLKLIILKRNGKLSTTTMENGLRPGIVYSIVFKDSTYKKGKLIFKATADLRNMVHNALISTKNYYRIAS